MRPVQKECKTVQQSALFKAVQALTGTLTPGAANHGMEFWLVYFCSPVEPMLTSAGDAVHETNGSIVQHLYHRFAPIIGTAMLLSMLLSYGKAAGHFAAGATFTYSGGLYVG